MSVSRCSNWFIIYQGQQVTESNVSKIFEIFQKIQNPAYDERERFLYTAHRCALRLVDETGYFSSELDLFIRGALQLCPLEPHEDNPLLQLQNENWEKEEVQTPTYASPSRYFQTPPSQYKILTDYQSIFEPTPEQTEAFLQQVFRYGREIFKNNPYFNQDLDKFITKAIRLAKVNLDASHPLALLQSENQNRPKVTTPRSSIKTVNAKINV